MRHDDSGSAVDLSVDLFYTITAVERFLDATLSTTPFHNNTSVQVNHPQHWRGVTAQLEERRTAFRRREVRLPAKSLLRKNFGKSAAAWRCPKFVR